jgi:hypothetical protein
MAGRNVSFAIPLRARLESDGAFQGLDLPGEKGPELSGRKRTQRDWTDPDTNEFFHKIPKRVEHPAHLAIATFVDLDL